MIFDSVNAGGALQQSLGGIETLFKDSADKVKTYAAQAYKTAGLSVNDYMESTTSFAGQPAFQRQSGHRRGGAAGQHGDGGYV